METEIWKDVVGYEGKYQVSNLGRVKSLKRMVNSKHGENTRPVNERILKPSPNENGYLHVVLHNSNPKTWPIHKIVARNFLNHVSDGTQMLVIDHIDHNRKNNRLDNLRIVTNRENTSWQKGKKEGKFSSVYTGVCFNKRQKTWIAHININRVLKHIGNYKSELEASEAYQIELKKLTP